MSNYRAEPLRNGERVEPRHKQYAQHIAQGVMTMYSSAARSNDWTLTLGKVGVILALAPFGGLFWAVNGGFSVLGLGVVAANFNSAGALFWAAISAINFTVPVEVPGLPTTQPLLPWGAVLGATILQIVVIWRKLRGRSIPTWLLIFAILLSLYDIATTFFGLGTVEWIASAGFIIQAPIALVLTFGLEATIGFLLRR